MSALTAQPWRNLDPSFVELIVTSSLDVDDIADEVTADVKANARVSIDRATLANLRLTAFAGLTEFLREAGHPEAASGREIFRAHGRAQQHAGRSVEEMLALYQLVGLAFWRRVSRAIQAVDVPMQEFAEITESLFAYVADLAAAAADGFVAAGNEAARGSQARRDRLVEILLEEPPPEASVVAHASRAAGWNPPETVAVIVTDAQPGAGMLETLSHADLAGRLGDHTALVLSAERLSQNVDRLAAAIGENRAGLGPVVPLRDFRHSYRTGAALLSLAHRRDNAGTLLRLDGNELDLMVLADESLAADLASAALAPLTDLPTVRRDALIETLAAWLTRPDQPLAIARDLHIHVQTVRYRVRQLRELLGATVDDPTGRARLALALRAEQLLRRSTS